MNIIVLLKKCNRSNGRNRINRCNGSNRRNRCNKCNRSIWDSLVGIDYIFAYDIRSQENTNSGTFIPILFANTDSLNGWTLNSQTDFTVPNDGTYSITYTYSKASSIPASFRIVLLQSPSPAIELTGSQTSALFEIIVSKTILFDLNQGTEIQFQFYANSITPVILAPQGFGTTTIS